MPSVALAAGSSFSGTFPSGSSVAVVDERLLALTTTWEGVRDFLLDKPLQIAIYIVIGVTLRWVGHRFIDHFIDTMGRAARFSSNSLNDADQAARSAFFRWRGRRRKEAHGVSQTTGATRGARLASRPAAPSEPLPTEAAYSQVPGAIPQPRGAQGAAPAADPGPLDTESVETEALALATVADRKEQRAKTIGSVLKSVVSFLLLAWVLFVSLSILGVNVAPIIASAGVVGVALGFGAQALVRDFLSGLFMLMEDQYGVGDVVDLGEATGTVESVGLRVTTVRDIDGTLWYVRNGEVLRIGNMSQGWAIARVDIPVALTSNLDKAQDVALAAAKNALHPREVRSLVIEPPKMLGVNTVGPDMLTLRITTKVRPGEQWGIQRSQQRAIIDAFDRHHIKLPYPLGRPFGPDTPAG